MELHLDLGYLFREGYAALDWVNQRELKYLRKLMYIDYSKMEYGECKISNKKISEGKSLNTDCVVKSLKF